MSINVGYSPKMARQYINVQFAPTALFVRKTEGICGFMDDDSSNDLIGPNGEAYKDPIIFTDSCKYIKLFYTLTSCCCMLWQLCLIIKYFIVDKYPLLCFVNM